MVESESPPADLSVVEEFSSFQTKLNTEFTRVRKLAEQKADEERKVDLLFITDRYDDFSAKMLDETESELKRFALDYCSGSVSAMRDLRKAIHGAEFAIDGLPGGTEATNRGEEFVGFDSSLQNIESALESWRSPAGTAFRQNLVDPMSAKRDLHLELLEESSHVLSNAEYVLLSSRLTLLSLPKVAQKALESYTPWKAVVIGGMSVAFTLVGAVTGPVGSIGISVAEEIVREKTLTDESGLDVAGLLAELQNGVSALRDWKISSERAIMPRLDGSLDGDAAWLTERVFARPEVRDAPMPSGPTPVIR